MQGVNGHINHIDINILYSCHGLSGPDEREKVSHCCDECGDHQEGDFGGKKQVSFGEPELHPAPFVCRTPALWFASTKPCFEAAL
jgi:hypothetical protein